MAGQLAVSSQSVADAGARNPRIRRASRGHRTKDPTTTVPIRPRSDVDKFKIKAKEKEDPGEDEERNREDEEKRKDL